jgi:ribosomal protein S18 acetylase RimI-like enzyme
MNTTFMIRKLGPGELDEYIRLRQEGVRVDPVGFGRAYTTEEKAPRSLYAAFLAPSRTRSIWGAFCKHVLVGMVRLETEERGTRKTIYSLYVCPAMRGRGIGRKLLCAAIDEAAQDPAADSVHLNAITLNAGALALYHSVGFRARGRVEGTFQVNGESYSEYRMCKTLPHLRAMADRSAPVVAFPRRDVKVMSEAAA